MFVYMNNCNNLYMYMIICIRNVKIVYVHTKHCICTYELASRRDVGQSSMLVCTICHYVIV